MAEPRFPPLEREPISIEIESVELDLRELVAEAVEALRPAAAWKGIDLLYVMPATVPGYRLGDPARIEQILTAMLRNAVDLTERGHVVLHVSRCDAAPGCLRFEVEDSGADASIDVLAARMEAFTHGEEGPVHPDERLGVDLDVARQVCGYLGGGTGVRMRPGRGSTFWCSIRLPVRAPPAPSPDSLRFPPPRDSKAPPPDLPAGLRVLLAEDHFINREVAVRMLELLGCEVHIAADGRQALSALAEGRFDLVLMDCRMPEMDGLSATRALRDRERALGLPHTPVLALTANALPGDREQCLSAGMDDFLAKPFRLRDLRGAIARGLAPRDTPRSSRAA